MNIAENMALIGRIRLIAILVTVVLVLLIIIAVWPDKPGGPSDSLFSSTDGATAHSGPPGKVSSATSDGLTLDDVTIENLSQSSGLGNVDLPQENASEIDLPPDFAGLIEMTGRLCREKRVRLLSLIAGDKEKRAKARTLAIHALRNFVNDDDARSVLVDIVKDGNDEFAFREAALRSLLHADGPKFEEFFIDTCMEQMRAQIPDGRLCELLVLAAYADVTLYNGRSVRKMLLKVEPFFSRSALARSLASFRLRLADASVDAADLARLKDSNEPVILSNLVEYLRRRAAVDEKAKTRLARMASQNRYVGIRKLAKNALKNSDG